MSLRKSIWGGFGRGNKASKGGDSACKFFSKGEKGGKGEGEREGEE